MKRIISLILSMALVLSVSPLAMAEEDYGENLCLGKESYMDTVYENMHYGYGAQNLNDGNIESTAATGGNSTDVRSGFQNYGVVDLGEVYELSCVIIRSRRDLNAEWGRMGFAAYVATKADFSDAVCLGIKDWAGDFGSDLICDGLENVVGRYIIAANINKRNGATVGEIEAYGDLYAGPGTGDFEDTENASRNASKLLWHLGIMDGITRTQFGASNLITRGEAAQIICNLANIRGEFTYGGNFQDVTADHPYAGYITAGVEYGFISKDTHYRPDEYIKGYELLKMILCVNGYYIKSQTGVIYPSNIIAAAAEIKLLEDCEGNGMDFISRSDAAIAIYNALMIKTYEYKNGVYEEGKESLLEKLYDRKLLSGIVTGNPISTLTAPKTSISNTELEIDNVRYYDESGDAIEYLGENVFFLTDEDESTVYCMWQNDEKTNKVIVDAEDIEEASSTKITTEVDGRTKRYKMVSHPYYILNGSAYSGVSEQTLIPENGYLELIDNNKDNTFDIIKIHKPEVMLVDSVGYNEEDSKLSIKGEGNFVDAEFERLVAKNTAGKLVSVDKIALGDVIYAYVSEDGKNVEILKLLNQITGSLEGYDEETATVNGVKYQKTAHFKRLFPTMEIGTQATFTLDKEGRLVYMSDEATVKNSEIMAVIQKCLINSEDNINYVRVYTQEGKFKDMTFAQKVSIDGVRKTLDQITAMGRAYFNGKIVFLTSNANDEIIRLVTEDMSDGTLTPSQASIDGTRKSRAGFYSGHQCVMPMKGDIPMFSIPVDENGNPCTGTDYEKMYAASTVNRIFGEKVRDVSGAGITFYGINEFNEPSVAVKRTEYASDSSTTYGVLDWGGENMIFESYSENVNDDGEYFYKIKGRDLTTGKIVNITTIPGLKYAVNSFMMQNDSWFDDMFGAGPGQYATTLRYSSSWIKDSHAIRDKSVVTEPYRLPITQLQKGDIIRYSNGAYTAVANLEVVVRYTDFDESKCKVVYSMGDLPGTILSTCRLQYGIVRELTEGHLKFAYNATVDETVTLSNFDGSVFVYEIGKDIDAYDISTAGVHMGVGDQILVYSSAGNHQSIVVYKK